MLLPPLPRLGALLALVALSVPGAAPATPDPAHPALQHVILGKALAIVSERYLHPQAARPRAMARAGIQALEEGDPGVLVLDDGPDALLLRVDSDVTRLHLDDVLSLDEALVRMGQAIDFVRARRADEGPERWRDLQLDALAGALGIIDRHSRVMAGSRLDDFNTRYKGTLVGIGARIGRRGGQLTVLKPFLDSPAERAGLREGDVISHVDGVPTAGIPVNDAVERIRGPEDVPVVLSVRRLGEDHTRVFVIPRAKVLVPSVESLALPDGVGYVNIDHFSRKTSKEFVDHVDRLRKAGELRGLVVDLRENQGGSMVHAARIVNYFVDSGVLVRTEGQGGQVVQGLTREVTAAPEQKRYTGPVVVLVNGRTASGSEIVAGGLKFLERGLVLGSQTYGKGTVQKVYHLDDDASLKLTVARYLLPGDRFINSVGVTPDLATAQVWLDPQDPTLPDALREPPTNAGVAEGHGGLDSRGNAGAGRPPTVDGSNAAPALSLWYPRVLDNWTAGNDATTAATPDAQAAPPADDPLRSSLQGDAGDDLFNDMELRLAWEVLRDAAPGEPREALIERARPIVAHWQQLQLDRMARAAAQRDIRWGDDSPPHWMDRSPVGEDTRQVRLLAPAPPLKVELELPEALKAGSESQATLTVHNPTDTPRTRLRARIESSSAALDGASFLIGDLAPGEGRSWTVPVEIGPGASSRVDTWRLYLMDDAGPLGGPFRGSVTTVGEARPELQLQLDTRVGQNEQGEHEVTAAVRVRNGGRGAAGEVKVLFSTPPEGIELREVYATTDELPAGATDEVELRARVRDPRAQRNAEIKLRASDALTGETTTLELELPLREELHTGWLRPARTQLQFPDSETTPARGTSPFEVRGSVQAAQGLRWVELWLGGDKVVSQRPEGPAPKHLGFKADLKLNVGPNRVVVRSMTIDGVLASERAWVLGDE